MNEDLPVVFRLEWNFNFVVMGKESGREVLRE